LMIAADPLETSRPSTSSTLRSSGTSFFMAIRT
jgi:hypothetical protein